jgi:hypothetical protein
MASRKRKAVYREPTDEELDEEFKQEQALMIGLSSQPSNRKKRARRTLSPPPKKKKPTQADRTCPHCGKQFAILSGLTYHIGEYMHDKSINKLFLCNSHFHMTASFPYKLTCQFLLA